MLIHAGIEIAPIKVRPKPNLPGRWTVFSGTPAVEAAKLEGMTAIACEAV